MTDHSMRMLAAHERRHLSIVSVVAGRSAVAVVAPRAGKLAPLTGELARAIAGRSHRLYCRVSDPAVPSAARHPADALSSPSSRDELDEPILRTVLAGASTVIAVSGSRCEEDAMTVILGSDRDLARRLRDALTENGFAAMLAPADPADADPGRLINRGGGGGVELILTRRLRRDLEKRFVRRPLFDCYVGAIHRAIAAGQAKRGDAPTGWSRAVAPERAPTLSSAA